MIRKATVRDVRSIHDLLKKYADTGDLLARAISELYDCLRDFNVCEAKDGRIIATCALHVCWDDLAEIRSLAVLEEYRGRGIGSRLLTAAVEDAKTLQVNRIFTLTYQENFFARHGFRVTDKSSLPQKIWADCVKCVKFPDCDEIAMIRNGVELGAKKPDISSCT
jgi:amino-acid N-acetyltransferase